MCQCGGKVYAQGCEAKFRRHQNQGRAHPSLTFQSSSIFTCLSSLSTLCPRSVDAVACATQSLSDETDQIHTTDTETEPDPETGTETEIDIDTDTETITETQTQTHLLFRAFLPVRAAARIVNHFGVVHVTAGLDLSAARTANLN